MAFICRIRWPSKPGVTQGNKPQKSIHRDFIPGLNQGCCVRDAGNARQSIFARDDGTMNQHSTPALDNGRRQRHDKGYIGINRISYQYLAIFKIGQIGMFPDHPGLAF